MTNADEIEQNYSLIMRPILDLIESSASNVDADVQMITSMLTTCSVVPKSIPHESGKLDSKFCIFEI
jgi:hypothetical protein